MPLGGPGPAAAELVEQRQEPLVPGERGRRVASRAGVASAFPGAVGAEGGVPRAGDGGVDGHAGGELVVLGGLAGHPQVDGPGEGFGG